MQGSSSRLAEPCDSNMIMSACRPRMSSDAQGWQNCCGGQTSPHTDGPNWSSSVWRTAREETLNCDCTVQSDQIYSLWSRASDASALLPDINYLKTGKALFFDSASSWIREHKRCDILALVESSNSSFAVQRSKVANSNPSWIPDGMLRRTTWPLLAPWFSPTLHTEAADYHMEAHELYNADAGISASANFLSIAALHV
jgi:hypothetical protein